MSIQLDWNVEAPDGEYQVGEDPAALEARRRRQRLLTRAALVLGAILLAAGIAAWVRYRQVQDYRRQMLIATVESEALALRIGDLQGFMKRQAGEGEWITHQTYLFQHFQALTPRVQIPGDIINLRLDGDQAEVTLHEVIDGESAEAIWLYEYTDRGWRHVATPVEPWSRNRAFSISGFEFSYNEQDKALADAANSVLARMRAETVSLTGYDDLPTLQVWIEPLGESIGWLDGEETTLVIPARSRAGLRLTALDASMQSEIAGLLAQRWSRVMFADLGMSRYHQWIEEEIADHIHHTLDPAAPPAPMLDPLTRAFGPELVPTLINSMHSRPIPAAALPAAMRATASQRLSADALLDHLALLLQAELGLRGRLDGSFGSVDGRVRAVFTDVLINGFPDSSNDPFMGNSWIEPASVTVEAAEEVGGVLWAEAHYTLDRPDDDPFRSYITYVPFRNIDGLWVRTEMLIPQDWGGDLTMQGGHITLYYPGIDAAYVEGLLPEMEHLYQRVAADFGQEDVRPITIQVTMTPWTYVMIGNRSIDLYIPSPHVRSCPERVADCFRYDTRIQLVLWALGRARGWSPGDNPMLYYPSTPIEQAMIQWELVRLYPPDTDGPPAATGITSVPALEALWLNYTYSPGEAVSDPRVVYLGLSTLFDVLVDRYGIEAMHALIVNLDRAISMESWLRQSLDIGVADVEPEWRARFEEALRENGYTLAADSDDGR